MADSKLKHPEADSDEELVHCGICFAEIDKPKALPCLHTFCLKCLTSWSDTLANKQPDKFTNSISCPSCREEFLLPEGGVKNLRSNFFVTKLKERKSIKRQLDVKDAKVPCTSCTEDSSTGVAVARCMECNDFLCEKCVGVHRSVRILQQHKVLTLEELRKGKLSIQNRTEQETCAKHKGEIIRFYCETCDEPICRDCSVVDHPRPEHKQVDLESTARERAENLLKLAKACQPVAKKIACAIEADDKISRELDAAFESAMESIRKTTDESVAKVVGALKAVGKAKQEELQQLKEKRNKEIECHRENLDLMQIKIRTSLQMVHQVTGKGSDHDVATMYSSLTNTMKQAREFEPRAIRASFAKITFIPNENVIERFADRDALGVLHKHEEWLLKTTIGKDILRDPRSVVFNSEGNIVVPENTYTRHCFTIFARNEIPRTIDTKHHGDTGRGYSTPWGLAVNERGLYYITDMNYYVKVYDKQGNLNYRFETVRAHVMDNGRSSDFKSRPYGLDIDQTGRVFVGASVGGNDYSVSIHNEDGSHVSTFITKVVPYYIIVSSDDRIFVSNHDSQVVLGYKSTGNHILTFQNPEGLDSWSPTGICFGLNNEVYVASKQAPAAVYRYSMCGRYLGVLVKDLVQPWGIAINRDQDSIAVVDQSVVKVFQLE